MLPSPSVRLVRSSAHRVGPLLPRDRLRPILSHILSCPARTHAPLQPKESAEEEAARLEAFARELEAKQEAEAKQHLQQQQQQAARGVDEPAAGTAAGEGAAGSTGAEPMAT